MPVSTIEAGVIRIGDGVTVSFPFSFEGRDSADIKVSNIIGEALVPVPSGFTATMNPNNIGGSVIFTVAPANGLSFYIYRDTDLTQLVNVSSQQRYDPEVVESVWDKTTFVVQELSEKVNRSVKTVPGLSPDTLLAGIFGAVTVTDANVVAAQTAETNAETAATEAEQSALDAENSAASAAFLTFGLGVTGSVTLLANLDATNTAAGVYRFDATTVGTFPTGVVASDTGLVEIWRMNSATAFMTLYSSTSSRRIIRRMSASVWQSWQEASSVWTFLSTTSAAGKGSAGVPFDITGLPAWATEVEVILDGLTFSVAAAGVGPTITVLNSLGPPGTNIIRFGARDTIIGSTNVLASYILLGAKNAAVNYSGAVFDGTIKFKKINSGNNWQVAYLLSGDATTPSLADAAGKFSIVSGGAVTGFRITHGHAVGSTFSAGQVTVRYR